MKKLSAFYMAFLFAVSISLLSITANYGIAYEEDSVASEIVEDAETQNVGNLDTDIDPSENENANVNDFVEEEGEEHFGDSDDFPEESVW